MNAMRQHFPTGKSFADTEGNLYRPEVLMITMLFGMTVLIAFPQISTFLPSLMMMK